MAERIFNPMKSRFDPLNHGSSFMKIAIIDDDMLFSRALGREFSKQSLESKHFRSIVDYLRKNDSTQYDLVLVDLYMEDTKGVVWPYAGIEVIAQLRRLLPNKTAVCGITGNNNHTVEKSCLSNGADALFQKSLDVDDVVQDVLLFMDRRNCGSVSGDPGQIAAQ